MGKKKKKQAEATDGVAGNETIPVAAGEASSEDLTGHPVEASADEAGQAPALAAAASIPAEDGGEVLDAPREEARAEATEAVETTGENKFLVTDREQIEQVLEAVIFASPKAMSLVRLRNLLNHFNYDTAPLTAILDDMIAKSADKGFQLVKVSGGYQYRSHPEHSEVLQKLLEDKPARLGASALEVLAIVAYKQPVTRADIDSVRGVDSGHLMKGLLEKDLIRTVGHAETVGRPLLYGTTAYFLEVFTLGSLDDLAQMDEVKRELAAGNGDNSLESALGLDSSGLAADPDRGAFDVNDEEPAEHPDFGLEDRAREELA